MTGTAEPTPGEPSAVELRRADILARLETHGRVEVGALSTALGVTEETIRRDLRSLELDGRLQRAHGGAVRLGTGALTTTTPTPLLARALDLVQHHSTVFLGAGAACEALAARLASAATVLVTASVPVALAAALADDRAVVHLLGGTAGADGTLTGAWTREQLAGLRLEAAVVEAQGVGGDGRLLHSSPEEAAVVAAAASVAVSTLLLGDPATFGQGGLAASIPSSRLAAAILVDGVAPRATAALVDAGVHVEHVSSVTATTGARS